VGELHTAPSNLSTASERSFEGDRRYFASGVADLLRRYDAEWVFEAIQA
jgi:hypothetical protein